jgi:hypothetical protein
LTCISVSDKHTDLAKKGGKSENLKSRVGKQASLTGEGIVGHSNPPEALE